MRRQRGCGKLCCRYGKLVAWTTTSTEALTAVGPRLRALRKQRETTLADLSAATGISVSTLSRLESGARRPTLELLLPLARAHGVTLDELVGAPPTGDPRIHLRPVTRHGMTMVPLTRRAGGIQAYKLVIPAGSGRPRNPIRRPTRATNGSTCSTDGCGSSSATTIWCSRRVRRPSSTPAYRTGSAAADRQPVEFLSLFGKQGERAHLRARPKG